MSTSILFINNKEFKKRQKFYEAFFLNNENDRVHLLDYKFAEEPTFLHIVSTGSEDKQLRITNYFNELSSSFTQTIFTFAKAKRNYDYDFNKKVDNFFDFLNKFDYKMNNMLHFT